MNRRQVSDYKCIGIFAQKSKVFNGPLHFKGHAPLPLCLSEGRGPIHAIGESPIAVPSMTARIAIR